MATMTVSLPEPMKAWVELQAETDQFGSASDYICALIRKDQQRQTAIAALQAAVTEAIESGEPVPFDPVAFKMRMRDRSWGC